MIRVEYLDLPHSVRGMTVRSFDGEDYYTIILNARLDKETTERAYKHELWHITHQDFDKEDKVGAIERRNYGYY